ncbi:MAG TPA: PUR family DNA/RNA-binding protein [Candidatus Paceibacterota bacterium]|nr:PUR family DNA/RNA-binding protein [Verrucomicrobiota bacterium]HOX03688.1 PUR family DNA/RNA-binding protein [Verrucomicrobiota bacterium]HRZ46604.1 PUR family DNA/RNA-binding protein [Candidatus Paceibacterota bacterium]HRZ91625.1 PUR family DNA/RNA-binding protein [Candidatus Paceibacterota bacterium]
MISNERPSPYGQRPDPSPSPKSAVPEESIKTDKIQIERKTFVFTLKENPRGRFLRITEDVNGRRDAIIVPATGLGEFRRILDEIIRFSEENPPTAAA